MSNIMLLRLITLILITNLVFWGFVWWTIPIIIFYCYRYTGYELIVFGILLDAYFVQLNIFPLYSLIFAGIFATIYWIKPLFMVYTDKNVV